MERCKVICHMYVSIDGKIDGDYMEEEGCDPSGEYYDSWIWENSNANANGRTTAEMYFAHENIDYSVYEGEDIDYSDNVLLSERYWVVFDRHGKCNWKTNKVNYGGKTARVVEVLTKEVPLTYLAYLKKIGISYIIAGENDLDLELALKKLKEKFHIETLMLTGGATINGAFHKAGLLDTLSLVVAPYIEGNKNEKNYAELSSFLANKYRFREAKPLSDGGVQLLFDKDN